MDTYDRVYAAIHLDAIEANMKAMQGNLSNGTGIMGVVKADGYGHGSVPVAKTINPYVGEFAVATADEAIILRSHGIKKPVLVLGVVHESRYEDLVKWDICPSLFTLKQGRAFSEAVMKAAAGGANAQAGFHLAVDTGMSRIGLTPDAAGADLAAAVAKLPGLSLQGVFTHFAKADETDKASTLIQLESYLKFIRLLNERGVRVPVCHCSNSAGIIDIKEANLDRVRAGISIYGLYPSREVNRSKVALTPAMELKSYITYIKTIEPGTPVSYGGTFVADRPMRIATIPVGYGDGYPRSLSGRGYVLIYGTRARILGRICMDQFMVDVTDIPRAQEGSLVTLIGQDQGEWILVEDIAELTGEFHYEIVCNIGKRVPRVYLRGREIIGTKDYFNDRYEDFC